MGVWIEIIAPSIDWSTYCVTPCVGVWIEMHILKIKSNKFMSLPAWECGLKFKFVSCEKFGKDVTPCVGVWIEMRT